MGDCQRNGHMKTNFLPLKNKASRNGDACCPAASPVLTPLSYALRTEHVRCLQSTRRRQFLTTSGAPLRKSNAHVKCFSSSGFAPSGLRPFEYRVNDDGLVRSYSYRERISRETGDAMVWCCFLVYIDEFGVERHVFFQPVACGVKRARGALLYCGLCYLTPTAGRSAASAGRRQRQPRRDESKNEGKKVLLILLVSKIYILLLNQDHVNPLLFALSHNFGTVTKSDLS